MEELLKVLRDMYPETVNGCVILHFEGDGKTLKSISPMLPADSIEVIFNSLSQTRDAIQGFLNDLLNKGLVSNNQIN